MADENVNEVVRVTINGNEVDAKVLHYRRDQNICTGIGNLDLVLDDNGTEYEPWDVVRVYEHGTLQGTYYVVMTNRSAKDGTYSLGCQDGSKRLTDYFISESYTIEEYSTTLDWIPQFLNEAGVGYSIIGVEAVPMSTNSTLGLTSAYDAIVQLIQYSGAYMYFDADGTCIIRTMGVRSGGVEVFGDDVVLSIKTLTHDSMLRNRAIVWGNADPDTGEWIFADISTHTSWNYDAADKRTVVLSNSNIYTVATAEELARKLLNEFSQINRETEVSVAGLHPISVGSYVSIRSNFGRGAGIVTSCTHEIGDKSGMVTTAILNERCPRLFAYWDELFDYVYIGTTTTGVWRKPLDSNAWESFNTGFTFAEEGDQHITDLYINSENFVCTTSGGNAYYRTLESSWTQVVPSGVTNALASGITVTSEELLAKACVINHTSNEEIFAFNNSAVYSGGWVVTFSGTQQNNVYQAYVVSGALTSGFDITSSGAENYAITILDIDSADTYNMLTVSTSGGTTYVAPQTSGFTETGGVWDGNTNGMATPVDRDVFPIGHLCDPNVENTTTGLHYFSSTATVSINTFCVHENHIAYVTTGGRLYVGTISADGTSYSEVYYEGLATNIDYIVYAGSGIYHLAYVSNLPETTTDFYLYSFDTATSTNTLEETFLVPETTGVRYSDGNFFLGGLVVSGDKTSASIVSHHINLYTLSYVDSAITLESSVLEFSDRNRGAFTYRAYDSWFVVGHYMVVTHDFPFAIPPYHRSQWKIFVVEIRDDSQTAALKSQEITWQDDIAAHIDFQAGINNGSFVAGRSLDYHDVIIRMSLSFAYTDTALDPHYKAYYWEMTLPGTNLTITHEESSNQTLEGGPYDYWTKPNYEDEPFEPVTSFVLSSNRNEHVAYSSSGETNEVRVYIVNYDDDLPTFSYVDVGQVVSRFDTYESRDYNDGTIYLLVDKPDDPFPSSKDMNIFPLHSNGQVYGKISSLLVDLGSVSDGNLLVLEHAYIIFYTTNTARPRLRIITFDIPTQFDPTFWTPATSYYVLKQTGEVFETVKQVSGEYVLDISRDTPTEIFVRSSGETLGATIFQSFENTAATYSEITPEYATYDVRTVRFATTSGLALASGALDSIDGQYAIVGSVDAIKAFPTSLSGSSATLATFSGQVTTVETSNNFPDPYIFAGLTIPSGIKFFQKNPSADMTFIDYTPALPSGSLITVIRLDDIF